MPKFFIISDIHGFYNEMVKALDEAGFDPNNENHWLITCGDHFDRGPMPIEVMRYLRTLPRKILVRGNHEELLVKCCENGYPGMHDYHNGTYDTICEIGGAGEGYDFGECCHRTLAKTHLFLESMVDYFETKNHIFIHSWIPLISKDGLPSHYTRNRKFKFNPNWRKASAKEWADSRWGNPYDLAEQGFLPDKMVVFGHFHTSYPRCKYEGKPEWGEGSDFSIYYGDGYIAVDGCCAYSGKINCFVVEDEFLESDINGKN